MDKDELQVFICKKPRDHRCDSDGPVVAIRSNGQEVLESEARKEPNWPIGFTGGSVTCSVCKRSAMEIVMWD